MSVHVLPWTLVVVLCLSFSGLIVAQEEDEPIATCFPPEERVRRLSFDGIDEILIARQSWASTEMNAHILAILLREKMGVPARAVWVSTGDMWDALENKSLHIVPEIWMETRRNEFTDYVIRRGTVESGGSLGVIGRIGWYTTKDVLDRLDRDYRALDYWRTYRSEETAALYHTYNVSAGKGMYVGGAPDWANKDQQLIDNLGLPFEIHWAESGSNILEMVNAFVANGTTPLVFYWWTPHEVFHKHDLVRVTFPEPTNVCSRKEATGEADCDYSSDFLQKVHSTDLPIPVRSLLRAFQLTNEDHISMLADSAYLGKSSFEAACTWILSKYDSEVSKWIPPRDSWCGNDQQYDAVADKCLPKSYGQCADGLSWNLELEECVEPPGFWTPENTAALVVPIVLVALGLIVLALCMFQRYHRAKRMMELEKNNRELMEARRDKEILEISDANRRRTLRYLMHEIRVPFHIVTVGIDSLLRDDEGRLGEDQSEVLHTVQASSLMVMNLLDDVLDLQKIEDGHFELNPQPMCIAAMIRKAYDTFAILANEKNVKFDIDVHGNIPAVADELRLTQALCNFITNAIKFTSSGGTVTLRTVLHNSVQQFGGKPGVQVSVVDSGAGISKENISKLFQAWSQIDAAALQNGKGSGLGLSLAKSLVEKHGGFVSVDSNIGMGSSFSFTIPREGDLRPVLEIDDGARYRAVVHSPTRSKADHGPLFRTLSLKPSAADKARSLRTTLEGNFGIATVLVVDDVDMVLKVMNHALKREGFVVHTAVNGSEALKVLGEHLNTIDLVLLDKEMPIMDGFECVSHIKAIAPWLPVVGVTGNALREDVEAFIKHGADGVLTKPLKVPDLEPMVSEVVQSLVSSGKRSHLNMRERTSEQSKSGANSTNSANSAANTSARDACGLHDGVGNPIASGTSSAPPTAIITSEQGTPTIKAEPEAPVLSGTKDEEHSTRHVMLVDDDVLGNKIHKRLLEREGFEVHVTTSGEAGVALLQNHPPGFFVAALVDYNMHGISGPAAVGRMLAYDPSLRISGLSGESGAKEEFLQRGAVRVMTKPTPGQEIIEFVKESSSFPLTILL